MGDMVMAKSESLGRPEWATIYVTRRSGSFFEQAWIFIVVRDFVPVLW